MSEHYGLHAQRLDWLLSFTWSIIEIQAYQLQLFLIHLRLWVCGVWMRWEGVYEFGMG